MLVTCDRLLAIDRFWDWPYGWRRWWAGDRWRLGEMGWPMAKAGDRWWVLGQSRFLLIIPHHLRSLPPQQSSSEVTSLTPT